MKKIFTLFIWLLLLPVTALAAAPNGQELYVGGMQISSTGYWTTGEDGNITQYTGGGTPTDNYIHYNANDNTLTLCNATIKKALNYDPSNSASKYIAGAAIGVFNQSDNAELTIKLEGTNTIENVSMGICVLATSTGGSAKLTITGEDNGSLTISSTFDGLDVQSGSSNATLTFQNSKVIVTSKYTYGVNVRCNTNSSASLTVNGGNLTTSGSPGILYDTDTASAPQTIEFIVNNSALVDARGGGIGAGSVENLTEVSPADGSVGIVFGHDRSNSKAGTVYGNVTLDESLTIGEDETLTIGKDASLTVSEGTTLTNKGTINVESGGKLEGTPTGEGTVVSAPKITTESLPEGTVGTAYSQTLAADNNPTEWTVTVGSLPDGLTLNQSTGEITGTPTTDGTSTFTVKAENSAGSDSKELSLTVKSVSVTGVTLDNTELSLFTGESETLTATVEPGNATNKNVTWSSDKPEVATVEDGKVTAVAEGEATITVTTEDGSNTAICQVKVTQSIYSITSDIMALDFGSTYIGYTQPTAQTVTITNTGNRPQTLDQPTSTTNFVVGTLSKMELAAGEGATFTVQPKAGLAVGTYSENITVSSSEGATLSITANFNVREEVEVKPSGSTNLSFTTDRDEFTLTATVYGENLNVANAEWAWSTVDEDVVALSGSPTWRSQSYSICRQAFTIKGTGTTTITATYDDGIYRGSVDFTVRISKPTPPDPISYYNIYVEDVCDGVEVTLSNNVVREGNSISVYVKKDTVNYTFDNFHVYYKEGYYDSWDELKEGTQPGEYPIKNIWNHIYIKAEGAEEKEDPTGIESIEGVKVYTKDGSLYVQTPQREQVLVISMTGAVVKNEEQVGLKQYHGLQPGIYIVRVGDRAYKLRLY